MHCKKVIHKKMPFTIDFPRSMTYFPQVIHNLCSTYQQVCDVKLALIGSKNCDRSGHSRCTTDRINPIYLNRNLFFLKSVSVNGIVYLSAS